MGSSGVLLRLGPPQRLLALSPWRHPADSYKNDIMIVDPFCPQLHVFQANWQGLSEEDPGWVV